VTPSTLPPAVVTAAGDSGVRLRVADAISTEAHERVLAWMHALDAERPAFVQGVVPSPSYRSVLVIDDCAAASLAEVTAWIDSLRARPLPPPYRVHMHRLHHVAACPVCSPVLDSNTGGEHAGYGDRQPAARHPA